MPYKRVTVSIDEHLYQQAVEYQAKLIKATGKPHTFSKAVSLLIMRGLH